MMIIVCGILMALSIYLLLETDIIRRVFGLILLSSTINLIILICGRLSFIHPAFVNGEPHPMSNPLPQALILTAIVIGFGLLAFLGALLKRLLDDKK